MNDVLGRARRYAHGQSPETLAQAVTAVACEPPFAAIAAPNAPIAKIITFAMAQRGKRYVLGAEGPDAWDCSSLVQAAYRQAGLSIPRSTFEQWPFGVRIRKGTKQPGDLVFFGCGGFVRHRLLASSDTAGHVSVPRMLVCVDTASAPDGCQVVRCFVAWVRR